MTMPDNDPAINASGKSPKSNTFDASEKKRDLKSRSLVPPHKQSRWLSMPLLSFLSLLLHYKCS